MNENMANSPFAGKKVSILGDSISTFDGVTNNPDINPTLEGYLLYYTPTRPETPDLERGETWWQQVIDALGMELCVNNAFSGSRIRTDFRAEGNAGFKTRCQQLHNAKGEEPDIILVYLGTNDFTRDYPNIGTVEALDYAKAEAAAKAGSIQAETVYEAYAMMLYKITQRYPKAKLYCMTIMPRRVHPVPGREDYSRYGQPTAYNAGLRSIAEHLGCTVIDLEHCGIPNDGPEYDYYIADQGLHPGKNGMEMIAKTVIRTMLGSFHSLQG